MSSSVEPPPWRQVDDGTEPDEEWQAGPALPWGWRVNAPKHLGPETPAMLRRLADEIEAREALIAAQAVTT